MSIYIYIGLYADEDGYFSGLNIRQLNLSRCHRGGSHRRCFWGEGVWRGRMHVYIMYKRGAG